MKRPCHAVQAMIFIIASGFVACTHITDKQSPAIDLAAEEIRVREVINEFFVLAEKRDWDTVGDLLAEDFNIFTDNASSFDKEAYLKLLKRHDLEVTHWALNDV